ncbi:MAG: AAA family ATPase, partial [Ilumatobacteraceae bacterium]
ADRATAAGTARARLATAGPRSRLTEDLNAALEAFVEAADAGEEFDEATVDRAAHYLADELVAGHRLLQASTATALVAELRADLGPEGGAELDASLASVADPVGRFVLARDWVSAFVDAAGDSAARRFDVAEAAVILATPKVARHDVTHGGALTITELVADHPRIVDGTLVTRLDELAEGAGALFDEMAERWPAYTSARRSTIAAHESAVRLDDYRPKVMAGFVRNRLIDTALLPLFGPNLARQLGTVDPADMARQGLLVVVSPPGYGKTTLMEWIADRLGLLIVKVNGPALGQDTTSLDPADAPNATARAEVEKLNLAFRMGRNVMLYLDDIQHTSPVLLSRFIPLADATRRIEGVIDGEPATFDLRGKRFCVVMAGNPYTTGGGRFEIPDMLVNRSDVFNLGDVSSEHGEAFARSYIENSLTACPPLAPHASKLLDDISMVIEMADGSRAVDSGDLEHAWDGAELDAAVRTVGKLRRAQSILLGVNEEYISSAATAHEDRTAPPFLLQGSYRNMARVAGRVVPVMTDDELDAVVDDHYDSEAQTLTDRAEQNLLAYKQLTGRSTEAEEERWDDIVGRYRSRIASEDGVGRMVRAIDRLTGAVLHDETDDEPPAFG